MFEFLACNFGGHPRCSATNHDSGPFLGRTRLKVKPLFEEMAELALTAEPIWSKPLFVPLTRSLTHAVIVNALLSRQQIQSIAHSFLFPASLLASAHLPY